MGPYLLAIYQLIQNLAPQIPITYQHLHLRRDSDHLGRSGLSPSYIYIYVYLHPQHRSDGVELIPNLTKL